MSADGQRIPLALALSVTAVLVAAQACSPPPPPNEPVEVTGGRVSGVMVDGIRSFKGIPYAAPPVGSFRWRAPQPVLPWEGVLDASEFGAECPQADAAAGEGSGAPSDGLSRLQGEDCLYLNVWTPADGPRPLPVLVWIHSGDLASGSGARDMPLLPAIVRKGIVLVSMNHRLGALGYLAHPALSAESPRNVSGNYGLLDQIAALQWVQRNIAAFGGDPARVTIAGRDAGAWSVSALLASPLAEGLFAGAIGQSGGRPGPGRLLRDDREGQPSAETTGVEFVRSLLGGEPDVVPPVLRSAPTDALLRTPFRAEETIDGWVLPEEIRTVFADGRQHKVPVIVGATVDASSLQSVSAGPDEDDRSAAKLWAQQTIDAGARANLYLFSRTISASGGDSGEQHARELPYVFNALTTDRAPDDGSPSGYTEDDRRLADAMSDYWVNFIRTGDPNGARVPYWPAYDRATEPYLEFGDEIRARQAR